MFTVFKFTLSQQLKNKTFTTVTLVISFILLILSAGTITIAEMLTGDDIKSDIDYVYVSDESQLNGIDYNILHKSEDELYTHIVFVDADSDIRSAADQAKEKSDSAVAMEVKDSESGFDIKIVLPEETKIKKKTAKKLAEYVSDNLKYIYSQKVELSDEQTDEILIESDTDIIVAGEDKKSEAETAVKMIVPLAMGIILYIMLTFYGQNISQNMVLEKNSKMIENLLIMVKPYDIIFGKLLALCLTAIAQFSLWILSAAAGIGTGIIISGSINEGGESLGSKLSDVLSTFIEAGAFSPLAIIFSFIAMMGGFVLFVSLSGLFSSFAGKTEEATASNGVYMMVVALGWILSYFNGLSGNNHIMSILRLVPFSSPFTVPADVLIGNMTVGNAMLSIAIMIISSIIIVALAAKIYHALVLYSGTMPKPKEIIIIIKNSSHKTK